MKQILTALLLLLLTSVTFAQVVVSEDVNTNSTWTSNNEYHLNGLIFVEDGVTLTIEAGTVIKGLLQSNITTGDGASALVIRRGAKLIAEGTKELPIIFTSELDDVSISDDLTKDDRGLWGGIILLGKAVTNQPTTENQIEGIPNNFDAKFGGNDDTDNSGTLRYISIRHGGFSISGVPGDEINGLTMGAVGSGTTIEHIEVFSNFDDGYEWFGGTVSPKYLVAAFCGDDGFDYDMGWRGKGQFWFSLQGSDQAGRGGEHDGGDDDETGLPYAIPVISNVTYIGSGSTSSGVGGDGNDRVIYFRDNAGGKYYNSIFTDFVGSSGAITIEDLASGEDSRSRLENGELILSNNYFWGIGASNTLSSQDFTLSYLTANGNTVTNPELRGISRDTNAGLDPRPLFANPASSNANFLSDEFFTKVTFLGAFNPNQPLWTSSWTALDSYGFMGNLSGGTQTTVNVTDDITTNTTWTANNVYSLDGLVFVNDGVTLTIEAGTVIKGLLQSNITTGDGASALVIRRGAKLIAEGTKELPIIFTSELDDVSIADDLTKDDRGLWGGIILLGKAVTNQPTTENQIEGIPNNFDAKFGGNDDTDNSGTLRYISIRHGGFSISGVPGDEINGLTMGAVGSGTTIEHIEVFSNFDDGYEWFGGTVSPKYLVAAFCGDDGFDYDMGWRGKGQFWFSLQGSDQAGRGGEHDGGDDDETGLPYAIPVISNVTYIGSGSTSSGVGGDGNDRVIYFRDNAGGKYYNSIFTDFVGSSGAITIEDLASGEDSRSRLENGELILSNNYFWGIGASNTLSSQDFVLTYLSANNNLTVDPEIISISREANAGLDPRPHTSSPAATAATVVNDPFFNNVSYLGAFNPADGIWTENWTALSKYGFTPSTTVDVNEDQMVGVPSNYSLDQNYPNPFNPATTIRFAVPEAANVKLRVFNILGQQVAELINGFRNAGTYNINWNAENVSSGVYIYRLEAGSNVITKKMTLLK